MSRIESYLPGTPCWTDLASADLEASVRFYGDLLGWEVPEQPNSAELGGYRRAQLDGDDVAGMAPLMREGAPSAWNTHIATDDIEAAAIRVTENGGAVVAEPMDVMGMLKFAIFSDPGGAVFGITQPGTFAGATRVNEPGAITWNELNTRDPEAAKEFYGAVFGWKAKEHSMQRTEGAAGPEVYVEFLRPDDEHSVAGMLDIGGMLPDEVPPHWLVYFGVEDTDAAAAKVTDAGGTVQFGPVTIDAGRFAVVKEPGGGATFAVIAPPQG